MEAETKKYLKKKRENIARIDALIETYTRDKENLQKMVYSISSPEMGERVQTTGNMHGGFTQIIEKIIALEDQINAGIDKLVDEKAELLSAINAQEDYEERLLLRYRYYDGCTWEEVEEKMHMSSRSVHRIHSRALQHFSEKS